MLGSILADCSILIVEDEPLIVVDITTAFEGTGAHLTATNSLRYARVLIEYDGLSAAILDHALPDGDSTSLYTRLKERGIPFMIYSGLPKMDGPCEGAPYLAKRATHAQLRDTMEALLRENRIRTEAASPRSI